MNKKKPTTKMQDNTKGQSKLELVASKIIDKTVSKSVPKSVAPKPLPAIISSPVLKPISKPVSKLLSTPAPKPAPKPVSKPAPKPVTKPVSKPAVEKKLLKKELSGINPETETYFVYLKNPLEYRRQLLECSRKVLFCLKINQEVFLIRQKKLEEMHNLKNSVRELLYLSKKFNDKLPKYNTGILDNMPAKDKVQASHQKLKDVKPVEFKGEKTEMERLEESLANIEKKLRTLQ